MADNPWRCAYCLRVAGKCQRHGNSPVCDGCRAHLAARGKKLCRACREVKAIDAFPERRAVCWACRTAANRERQRAYMQTYRQANRERRAAYRAAYEAANPEKARAWRQRAHLNQQIRESARLRQRRAAAD